MSESAERLERFLAACCDGASLDDRVAELDDLGRRAGVHREEDVSVLSALASETRYGLLRALVLADRDLCVCELHPLFDVGESAVSHALAELRDAGLVARREEGKWHYYAPTARAERLVAALDATRERGGGTPDDGEGGEP